MHFLSCYGSLETTQNVTVLIAEVGGVGLGLVGLGPLLDLKDMEREHMEI